MMAFHGILDNLLAHIFESLLSNFDVEIGCFWYRDLPLFMFNNVRFLQCVFACLF